MWKCKIDAIDFGAVVPIGFDETQQRRLLLPQWQRKETAVSTRTKRKWTFGAPTIPNWVYRTIVIDCCIVWSIKELLRTASSTNKRMNKLKHGNKISISCVCVFIRWKRFMGHIITDTQEPYQWQKIIWLATSDYLFFGLHPSPSNVQQSENKMKWNVNIKCAQFNLNSPPQSHSLPIAKLKHPSPSNFLIIQFYSGARAACLHSNSFVRGSVVVRTYTSASGKCGAF